MWVSCIYIEGNRERHAPGGGSGDRACAAALPEAPCFTGGFSPGMGKGGDGSVSF